MSPNLQPTTGLSPRAPESDPYRWLERRHSEATVAWLAAQDARIERYFAALEGCEALRIRVARSLDVETVQQPARVGEQYFYLRRATGQEQPCICVNGSDRASERVLFDPNTRADRFLSGQIYAASATGHFLAYKLRHGGEHSCAVEVVRTRSGERCHGLETGEPRGLVFTDHPAGFFYCHEYQNENAAHEVRFRPTADPGLDEVVLRLPRSTGSRLNLVGADNGRLAAVYYHRKSGRRVADLYLAHSCASRVWECVVRDSEDSFVPFLHQGRIFLVTHVGAPNGMVVEFVPARADERTVIIPEGAHPIRQLCFTRDRIFAGYLVDLDPLIQEWSFAGDRLGSLPVAQGTTITFCTPLSSQCEELFYISESFARAPEIHCYHPLRRSDSVWHSQRSPVVRTRCQIERASYRSIDGTTVSMYVVHPGDRISSEKRPAVMTAYGGFGACMTPSFSVLISILLELGFRFALPLIRGGGEWGPAWHHAGRRHLHGKTIEDFLSGAEWLIGKGLTSSDCLAVFGGSHSGLMVSAAMARRPELFGAVLAIAPLTDMLRYHLFDGAGKCVDEYGSADDPQDLAVLSSYSPYHNVQTGTDYPPALFVCGDRDTKCNAAHSRKMVAQLQNRTAQRNQILLDHTPERGHSPNLPLSTRIEALTRRIAFLCHELQIALPSEWPNDPTRF